MDGDLSRVPGSFHAIAAIRADRRPPPLGPLSSRWGTPRPSEDRGRNRPTEPNRRMIGVGAADQPVRRAGLTPAYWNSFRMSAAFWLAIDSDWMPSCSWVWSACNWVDAVFMSASTMPATPFE